MLRLSDSQLVVLTAACQRADRCVFPVTAKLKGNAAGNVLKSLLKKDLIKEVRAKNDDTVWRHDEQRGRMTLVATKAAFAALGIDPRDDGRKMLRPRRQMRPQPLSRPNRIRARRHPNPRSRRRPARTEAGTTHRACCVEPRVLPSTKSSKPWNGSRTPCGAQSRAR